MKIYLVGGAVRDKFMGIPPKDCDYVIVGATADDVKLLLERGFEQVGKDFPVFLHPVSKDEYALARTERKTGVGYGGFEVSTDDVTLIQDLARRDLSMNAMAMDLETGEIIDPYGGKHDIEAQVIRHTTEAFSEDPLRALRVARFAARYEFTIAPETVELVKRIGETGELNHLTPERIWLELEKSVKDSKFLMFFNNLVKMDILKNCDFLRALFGEELSPLIMRAATRVVGLQAVDRFELLIAAIARTRPAAGATRRMQVGFDLLRKYGDISFTPEGVHELIRVAGAFQEGDKFNDLMRLIELSQPFEVLRKHINIFVDAAYECRLITAEQFPELQGKELGEAITRERIAAVNMVLKSL